MTRDQSYLPAHSAPLRRRQRLGKYKIDRLIGNGGFARVYAATDTIEGVRVALKIPHDHYVSPDMMELFKKEVRTAAKLEHPHVLGVKDASFIDGRFVVVTLLGERTLEDRLSKRISSRTALDYAEQMLSAVAYAHEQGLIHCDIKPDNFILFPGDHLRLTDFGIAKVESSTLQGSGTGTVGYMAPEQAMGRPTKRSDVFSLGLIIYRMLSGHWPEYPFDWPPPGATRLRQRRIHPDFIKFLKKSIAPMPRHRFADAIKMEAAFQKLLPKTIRHLNRPGD